MAYKTKLAENLFSAMEKSGRMPSKEPDAEFDEFPALDFDDEDEIEQEIKGELDVPSNETFAEALKKRY